MTDPDDDVLAAEYVLGTLGSGERTDVEKRLGSDPALRRSILAWEERLSPLLGLYAEAVPASDLLAATMARLDGSAAPHRGEPMRPDVLALRRSVRRWRLATATAGVAALAAALTIWIAAGPEPRPHGQFVAVLQKDAGSPAILLDVDVGARRAVVRQVASDQPIDKSYELWLINPEVGNPQSLGLVQARGATKASLASYDAAVIARATYAITLEPAGGSPTGAPSGPPILSGKLVENGG